MPGGASALVGRDAELLKLAEWAEDLTAGTGRAVLVEGEPGIGKSALVRTVVTVAEAHGCQAFWAEGDELGQALPLRPLLDALRARELDNEPRFVTIQRLLRGEVNAGADPTVAACEQMLTLLTELCSAAPTVIVVDDLQWADAATIGVWEYLTRLVDRSALLLIGIVRPIPQRDELDAVRRAVGEPGTVRLGGLPPKAVANLVTAIAAGSPGEDLLRLADGAAGNPLYVTELMEALLRSNRLKVNGSGTVEVTGGPVPDSLYAAIAHRLDFLPRDLRGTLQAAALLGTEFLVSDLALVLNSRIVDLVPAIDEARTAGVLKEAREKLAFRHPLIRQALYDDIADSVRPAWHRDAARALAEAGAPHDRVARQLLAAVSAPGAGPLDEALLDWLAEAAPTLIAQTPRTAIDLLRQASRRSPASTPRGAVLTCRLADALFRSGDHVKAERVAHRAMAVITNPDLLTDLHWTVSQCRALAGRADESFESLARALTLPDISARHRARLLVMTARAHRDLGEVTVAGRVAAEALTTAEQTGDSWAVAWALHVLIIVSMMQGNVEDALPLFERALEVVEDDTLLTDLGLLLQINKAVALGDLDRYDDALRVAERVRDQADRSGSLVRLAQAQTALTELLFEVGRWDDAQAEIETLSDDFKDPGVTCCDRGIAAVIAFHRGDPATAREHLRLAAPSADKIGNRVIASLTLARSLHHEINDAPAEALAELTACVTGHAEELDEMEDLLPEAARLAAQVGTTGTASDIAAQATMLARQSQVPHRLAAAAYCRGLLDRDPALLLHAAERYDQAGRPLLRAKALEAAAITHVGRGDREAARAAFTTADDLYSHLGANWDQTHLRASLRRYGIRRGPRAKHRQAKSGWGSLTPTETKIAGMVAAGLPNRQIAERLVLSPRTVGTHVSHILAKLGVRSRIDIAREAADHVLT
ncbi:LuxR family transcriptional regulator [Actinophytocola xinjiangensis]|uniref:LuxR family transcriptional regulator n=1 Tax=Actinophytocola xinjiangensis TaxID=485602 RepID=A0A7Z1AU58_9PSEU|nr:LuxR family transcriptional regulator [Actinophytocola xinjiangensis]OLF05609.1 LuxR family transcriptional regulator [Actinophytocola xinjiangensis]